LKEGGNKTVVSFCYPLLQLFAAKARSIKERKRDVTVGGDQTGLAVRILRISFIVATAPHIEAVEFITKKKSMKHHRPKLISSKQQSPTISQIWTARKGQNTEDSLGQSSSGRRKHRFVWRYIKTRENKFIGGT
jgi:hypothetical protein